jgi:hypothetical protein
MEYGAKHTNLQAGLLLVQLPRNDVGVETLGDDEVLQLSDSGNVQLLP